MRNNRKCKGFTKIQNDKTIKELIDETRKLQKAERELKKELEGDVLETGK